MDATDPDSLRAAVAQLSVAIAGGAAWPLDKRETFQAFVLMGLASRLQPSSVDKLADQQRLVALSGKMADLAVADNAERTR